MKKKKKILHTALSQHHTIFHTNVSVTIRQDYTLDEGQEGTKRWCKKIRCDAEQEQHAGFSFLLTEAIFSYAPACDIVSCEKISFERKK